MRIKGHLRKDSPKFSKETLKRGKDGKLSFQDSVKLIFSVLQGKDLKNELWSNNRNVHRDFEGKSRFSRKPYCLSFSKNRSSMFWLNNDSELCSAAA